VGGLGYYRGFAAGRMCWRISLATAACCAGDVLETALKIAIKSGSVNISRAVLALSNFVNLIMYYPIS